MVCLQRSLPWRKPPDPATPSRPSTPVRWLPSVPLNRSPRAMAKPVCSVEQKKKKTGSEHARIGQQLLTSPRRRSRRRRRPRAAVVLRRGSRATGGAAAAQHPFPLEASPAQAFSLSALLCSALLVSLSTDED